MSTATACHESRDGEGEIQRMAASFEKQGESRDSG
jgi:hypothetical protein